MELRLRGWTFLLGLVGILTLAFAGGTGGLIAQESGNADQNTDDEHVVLVRTYNIRKVYRHRLGYRIDIADYNSRIRTIYAKISWFADPEQRDSESANFELLASMNYIPVTSSMTSNYLTLRYEGGKLMALSIYIDPPSYARNSIWGAVSRYENIDGKFDINTITFSEPPVVPAGKMPKKERSADLEG